MTTQTASEPTRAATQVILLSNNVLVRQAERESVSAGGIVLPDLHKERPGRGEVIGVGTGKVHIGGFVQPMAVRVGDTVLFQEYAVSRVNVEGAELLIMQEDSVLAVIR